MIQAALLVLSSLLLCRFSWTGAFAFEFCLILGGFSFAIYFLTTCVQLHFAKVSVKKSYASIFYLAFPLLVVLLFSFKIRTCEYRTGFLWFCLLPVVSSVFGVSSAVWGNHRGTTFIKKLSFGFLPSVLFFVLILFDLYYRPSLFLFHPGFGYYPGPLYDEWIPLLPKVVTFRAWTLCLSLWMLLDTTAITKKIVYPVGFYLLSVLFFRPSLGWNYSHKDVQQTLSNHLEESGIHLHYRSGTFRDEAEARTYLRNLVFYAKNIASTFQIQDLAPIHVYVYPDDKTKYELTGTRYTAIGHPLQRVVHLLKEPSYASTLPHELSHVISASFGPWPFRINFNQTLLEGLATSVEEYRGSLSIHEWAASMDQLRILPDLTVLLGPTGFLSEAAFRAYLAAGSFCQWLIQTEGVEKFKVYYQRGDFQKTYGRSLFDAVRDWKDFLKTVPVGKKAIQLAESALKSKPIFQRPCAHDVADVLEKAWSCKSQTTSCKSNYLATAMDYSGGDFNVSLLLAREWMRQSEWERAEQLLNDLLRRANLLDLERSRTLLALADLDVFKENIASATLRYESLSKADQPQTLRKIIFLRAELLQRKQFRVLKEWIQEGSSEPKNFKMPVSSEQTIDDLLSLARGYESKGDWQKATATYHEIRKKTETLGQALQIERDLKRIRFLTLAPEM